MRQQERESFLPFVTVDNIMKFDPQKEETYTESRLINAVLRATAKVGAADSKRIANYLAMDDRLLNHGVRIACGMNLTDLRGVVTIKAAAQMHAEDPKSSLDEVAERLGFANRAGVWAILNHKKHAAIVARFCPDLLHRRNMKRRDS